MALNIDSAVRVRASVDGLNQIEGLRKGLDGLGKEAGKTSGFMDKLRTAAVGVGASLASAAIIRGIKQSADTFATYQTDVALLENGLKNLGVTGPQELEKLIQSADKLGKQTLFNEEDFNKGFGLLTSFTNISIGSYERVATAAADLAQTSGTSVSSAMMQLAKALNDPVAGLSALSRSGVQFTEDQKAMIQSMVAVGDVAGAQNVILAELEKQYGGNATAAAQGLAGAQDTLGESFVDLQKAIGGLVEEPLTLLIGKLSELVFFVADQIIPAIDQLPGPLKDIVGLLAALAIGLAAIAGPVLMVLPGIAALLPILKSIVAINFAATLASWAGAIGPVIGVLGTLGKILIGVFTGPVGWVALAAAAGVAIYAFRDQIAEVFGIIGQMLTELANAFKTTFIDPIIEWNKFLADQFQQIFTQIADAIGNAFQQAIDFVNNTFVQPATEAVQNLYQGILDVFNSLPDALRSPFEAAGNMIRGIVNNILNGIGNAISAVVQAINNVIQGANQALARLNMPQIPYLPFPSIPQFADGGMVSGPTLAMVGEGGEPEYIVPESKAAGFANNWMSGRRGLSAIPGFASGGVVMPSGGASSRGLTAAPRFADGGVVMPANAQVNIQTGPVTQMDGTNFVTTQDMSRAVQSGVQQTLSMLRNNINTRRAVGIA